MDGKLILIVDDEPRVRFTLALILKHHGFQVLEADNGLEALRILAKAPEQVQRVDLVVTDIKMPVMDGLELIKILKQSDDPINILVMTGYGDRETMSLLQGMGVCGVLHKPFDGEQLIAAIRPALAES
ncbi:response regulator [Desulfonatronum lacustre]|uniref:response regulator n=1 Tax=Desulfonatronum lacustre TaxID=66849 RepID=UPI000490474F|nr:response regulator [Desulfonatronum lacustre]SMP53026.1 two-component system, response regulator, stage 0 sporulation protein F [Desulfonatronum zhilinae]